MGSVPPTPPGEGSIQSLGPVDAKALKAQLEAVVTKTADDVDPVSAVDNCETRNAAARRPTLDTSTVAQLVPAFKDLAMSSPESYSKSDDDDVCSPPIADSAGSVTSFDQEESTLTCSSQKQAVSSESVGASPQDIILKSPEKQQSVTFPNHESINDPHEQQQSGNSGRGTATLKTIAVPENQTANPIDNLPPSFDDSVIHPALRESNMIYGISENDRFPIVLFQRDGNGRMLTNPLAAPESLDEDNNPGAAGPSQTISASHVSGRSQAMLSGDGSVETTVADGIISLGDSNGQGWAFSIIPANNELLAQSLEAMSRNISNSDDAHAVANNGKQEILRSNDAASILGLSDTLRQVLRCSEVPHTLLDKLIEVLNCFLEDEGDGIGFTIDMLLYSRLDKLFAELLRLEGKTERIDPLFEQILQKSRALEYRLQKRLGKKYMELDLKRTSVLKKGEGLLRDVHLNTGKSHKGAIWLIEDYEPIYGQSGHLKFNPGDWWLNIECAFRDGIVGSPDENLTFGRYGNTALALLTGSEVRGDNPNTIKYIRTGKASDVHLRLMTQLGREVRVVRGYQLISPLAPKAGVRYDGLYHLRNYSYKHDNGEAMEAGLYRSEITLERLPGQRPIEDLAYLVPSPSQLDDWYLYKKILSSHIRAQFGGHQWYAWFVSEEQGQLARETAAVHRETTERMARFRNLARGTSSTTT